MKSFFISRVILFLVAFIAIIPSFFSQTYHFDHYTVQEGLSQSNVLGIVQDKKGYYWLATETGLNKFDGKTFQNYTTQNGLAENNIKSIFLDSKGNIWIGHSNSTLTIFNGTIFKALTVEGFPKDKSIDNIYEDKLGKIWVSVSGFGLACFENPQADISKKSSYKLYAGKQGLSDMVTSVLHDTNGNYWFATNVGLKILKKGSDNIDFFIEPGGSSVYVFSLFEDKSGNIWMGAYYPGMAGAMLVSYNPQKNTLIKYPATAWINKIYETTDGTIWGLQWGGGIIKIKNDKSTQLSVVNGLSSNKIYSITQDKEGNVLLANFGTGISVYKGEKFVSVTSANGLPDNKVRTIAAGNNGTIWLGTMNGLSVVNDDFTVVNYTKVLGKDCKDIRVVLSDRSYCIWIALDKFIFKYDQVQKQFIGIPQLDKYIGENQFITSMVFDKKNNLWIGTVDGLLMYNPSTGETHSYRAIDGLLGNNIDAVFCDSKNRLWLACYAKGISVYENGKFISFTVHDGFDNTNPAAFSEDADGNVWIGTKGSGAFKYDGNKFVKYSTKDGLPSDYVNLIAADKKNDIWLGTNKGLARLNSKGVLVKVYDKKDGFFGIETSTGAVSVNTQGDIWFGTVNGAIKYSAFADAKNNYPPVLNISTVKINNKPVEYKNHYELSYLEKDFYIEFVGISLYNPDKVTYRVMLEGFDKDWRVATKQNFEVFSNLPPNNYKLLIEACNADGACVSAPIGFSFHIKPPFWKTWWFYLVCAIIVVTLIIVYIKVREKQLVAEKKILEEKVKERTAEVVQKNMELDEKNKDITASIRYAKRIQDAILLPDELIRRYLPKTFVLFNPKDIVSGDFYWIYDKKDIVLFAAVDCTGHGVPGAFMSIVGHNLLDKIVGEDGIIEPAQILDKLNKSVSDTLRQSQTEEQGIKDGMDIALCSFNRKTNELQYAGAYNPLWIIRNGELIEFKGDKFPIGNLKVGEQKKFSNHSVILEKGDTAYVFSDGYADQFGGPKGKKLMYSKFKKILLENQNMNMDEQGVFLQKKIKEWMGEHEQVDDILVIGTRL